MVRKYLFGGATLGLLAGAVIALSPLASARTHPQLTERQILRIALKAAAAAGDPRPILIQHSEGTHSKANQIASGGYFGGNAWSYLIAERGKFVFKDAPRPFGASAPRGSVITLVLDSATGRVSDDGISYRYPALPQLGPVTTDWRAYKTCPARDRQPLTSTTPGASRMLVPSGARQVLVCRYSGLNPISRSLRLQAERLVINRSTVGRLASEFNALTQLRGVFNCPADFGRNIIAIFRYLPAPKSDDPVTLDLTGCTSVTNGHLTRTAAFAPGPTLIRQLERLTQ